MHQTEISITEKQLSPIIEWAKSNDNIGLVLGYGSFFNSFGNPKDIDLVVLLNKNCSSCELRNSCETEETLLSEFQKDIPESCPNGFYDLLQFARNREESELPLDIKIVYSDFLISTDVEAVSTITKEGWCHWTFCGHHFFRDMHCIYVSDENEKFVCL